MYQEKFCLTWQGYNEHLRRMMQELIMSGDFTDVTIVSDDKKKIKAHRNVLSASSPVFKNILHIDTGNKHPLIYLRGIHSSEIQSILEFIYFGEAKCNEERINEFLTVAQSLEISALNKNDKEAADQSQNIQFNAQVDPIESINEFKMETSLAESMTVPKQVIAKSQDIVSYDSKFQCPKANCDRLFANKRTIYEHIKSVHEKIRFSCDHCDFQTAKKNNLKVHIQAKHEGIKVGRGHTIKYACKHCDHESSSITNLRTHTKNKHETNPYPIDWGSLVA